MPSTFECPHCRSRYNNLITSKWNPATSIETTTYQCKHCFNFFNVDFSMAENENETPKGEQVLEM
jgi:DNA-directed RNA polymerase subunit M/transcription elongation factor TFIIS